MADNHIEVNIGARLGYELRLLVDGLATNLAKLNQLKATMDGMDDGDTHAKVEERFGLPAGSGAVVLSLFENVKTALDGIAVLHQFVDWFEGKVG